MICAVCKRQLGDRLIEEHHLVPRTFKGKETIRIHKMCHQKIHATFCERELAKYYHTPDRILEHEEMQKFVRWISKKPSDFYDKNDDTKHRNRRR